MFFSDPKTKIFLFFFPETGTGALIFLKTILPYTVLIFHLKSVFLYVIKHE